MATIDKQSRAWRVRVRLNGINRTKTFTKKADATRWAAVTERAIALGLPLGGDQPITLGSLLERYAQEITPLKKGAASEIFRLRVIQRHSI